MVSFNSKSVPDLTARIPFFKTPFFKLDVNLSVIIQALVFAVTLYAAVMVMKADVDHIKDNQVRMEAKIQSMAENQERMATNLNLLREEVRYYRERLDRIVEATAKPRYSGQE